MRESVTRSAPRPGCVSILPRHPSQMLALTVVHSDAGQNAKAAYPQACWGTRKPCDLLLRSGNTFELPVYPWITACTISVALAVCELYYFLAAWPAHPDPAWAGEVGACVPVLVAVSAIAIA
jgi:hypothetical protein